MMNRRKFMGTAAAAAGWMIMPRRVLGGPGHIAPSDRINIGCIAVGGRGFDDIRSAAAENVVALCDVDNTQMAAQEEEVHVWTNRPIWPQGIDAPTGMRTSSKKTTPRSRTGASFELGLNQSRSQPAV